MFNIHMSFAEGNCRSTFGEARAIGDALQLLGHSFPVGRPLATVMQERLPLAAIN